MEASKVFLRDMKTGKELEILPGTVEVSWSDKEEHPIDINNSYKFECSFEVPPFTVGVKELFESSGAWKTACRIADELNDMIEEYHAPRTPRQERRVIKREFDKIFKRFRKHCQECHIDFKFERPQN